MYLKPTLPIFQICARFIATYMTFIFPIQNLLHNPLHYDIISMFNQLLQIVQNMFDA